MKKEFSNIELNWTFDELLTVIENIVKLKVIEPASINLFEEKITNLKIHKEEKTYNDQYYLDELILALGMAVYNDYLNYIIKTEIEKTKEM